MVQKVTVKREFQAGLRYVTTVNPAVNGYLICIREGYGSEMRGMSSPFISCAQDTVEL